MVLPAGWDGAHQQSAVSVCAGWDGAHQWSAVSVCAGWDGAHQQKNEERKAKEKRKRTGRIMQMIIITARLYQLPTPPFPPKMVNFRESEGLVAVSGIGLCAI